jgi:hypothetical protein
MVRQGGGGVPGAWGGLCHLGAENIDRAGPLGGLGRRAAKGGRLTEVLSAPAAAPAHAWLLWLAFQRPS